MDNIWTCYAQLVFARETYTPYSHWKSLLLISAKPADDCRGDWYAHSQGMLPLTDSQIKEDLMSCRCFLARRMLSCTLPCTPVLSPILIKYNTFLIGCQVNSAIAAFNVNIKKVFDLLRYLTTSDQEGWWWLLHASCLQIFQGNLSWVRCSHLLGLVLTWETAGTRSGTTKPLPAVHYVIVYSARPDGQLQLCLTRYEVGAAYPAAIKQPGRHRRPDTKVISSGGVGDPAHIEQLP